MQENYRLVKEGNHKERLEQIVDRTKKAGAEIKKHLRKVPHLALMPGVETETYLKDLKTTPMRSLS